MGVAQTYPLFEKSRAKTFIENRGGTVLKQGQGRKSLVGFGAKPQGLAFFRLKKTLGVAQTYLLFGKSGAKTFIENRGGTVLKKGQVRKSLVGFGAKPQGLALFRLRKTLGVAQTYPLFEKSGAKDFYRKPWRHGFKNRVKGGSPLWGLGQSPKVLHFFD